MEHLTDLQIAKIESFCADKEMYEAVRQVMLAGLYTHGVVKKGRKHDPLINGAFNLVALATENPIPDAELGAHLRGTWFAVNALVQSFNRLDAVKSAKVERKLPTVNEAE